MSKRFALFASAAFLAFAAVVPAAFSAETMSDKTVNVGGAPMYPSKNIIQNAVNSKDHTTLVAAVKAAGLVDTLQGPGPFTVFAPTNAAFGKLPAGTVDNLLKPENKGTLTKVLTYHVVPGRMTAVNLMKAVKEGEGEASSRPSPATGSWSSRPAPASSPSPTPRATSPWSRSPTSAVERRDPCHRHRAAADVMARSARCPGSLSPLCGERDGVRGVAAGLTFAA